MSSPDTTANLPLGDLPLGVLAPALSQFGERLHCLPYFVTWGNVFLGVSDGSGFWLPVRRS